jgi:predicted RNA-binding Zn ribbon-like protein
MASTDGVRWTFDPGALCLELLTTGGPGALDRHERLHAPADLDRWLAESRLRLAPGSVTVSDAELAAARRLRDALWRLAGGWSGAPASEQWWLGPPVPAAADLAELNAAAARPGLAPQLDPDARSARWAVPATGTAALASVARDAVRLRAGPFGDRIRYCGAADCYLIFVDTSRPGRRRWCSMDRCGNRDKARALRARRSPAS